MKLLLALITIMFWPIIPLFWIPVHLVTSIFHRLGRLTYVLAAIFWIPIAYFIFQNRSVLFRHIIDIPLYLSIIGLVILAAGSLLHIWTGALLSPRSLIGIPEIIAPEESKLIDRGPFSVIRHPTYLAHTLMFSGVFIYTGALAVGVLTLLDLAVVTTLIMPLEERELIRRFGESYVRYMDRVPRLIPRIHSKR